MKFHCLSRSQEPPPVPILSHAPIHHLFAMNLGLFPPNLEHIKSVVVSTLLTVDKQVERSAYHSHPLCRQIESFTVGIVNRPEVWDVHLPLLSTRDCVPL